MTLAPPFHFRYHVYQDEVVAIVYLRNVDIGRIQIKASQWSAFMKSMTTVATFGKSFGV